jgi:hypothetical protein
VRISQPEEIQRGDGIHSPGLKNIDKSVVWVFPELVVCLDCGTAEFAMPEAELRQLAKGDAATPRATAIKRAKVSRKTASSE